jgi:hypothetical protein
MICRWNRNIRTDRPTFVSKHHQLEAAWVYHSPGADADLAAARAGPVLAVTATDETYGAPLSGHLRGRGTWRPAPPGSKFKKIQARGVPSRASACV